MYQKVPSNGKRLRFVHDVYNNIEVSVCCKIKIQKVASEKYIVLQL